MHAPVVCLAPRSVLATTKPGWLAYGFFDAYTGDVLGASDGA